MRLSIWHCLVFYVCSDASLEKLVSLSGLPINLINQSKLIEKWDAKRAQFLKLSPKQKVSLDILELIFGDFQADEAKKAFVEKTISKLSLPSKNSKRRKVDKSEIKLQKINQLGEFGMSAEQAATFIEEIEKGLGKKGERIGDDFSDIIPDDLSIQDKLDTINHSYGHLVAGYSNQLASCQKILEDAIDFYASEINELKATKPRFSDFEDIAGRQRTLSYNAQSLFRLIQLYYDMTGAKTHVNHHATAAKMFSGGYITMRRDVLDRCLPSEQL